MQTITEKAKDKFIKMIEDFGSDPWSLRIHTIEAEKWAKELLKKFPQADEEVVILTVWLHDIGHYPIPEEDHAVVSERIARKFLENEEYSKTKEVLHCIRSHRNKDVKPETLEAKLFAMIDSASHFTYGPYTSMAADGRGKQAMEKLERDYCDLGQFPEIKKEYTPLYKAWKKLIDELMKIR